MRTQQVVDRAERRFDRGAWLTLAVVMGWMLLIVPIILAMQYPSDGWASTRYNDERGIFVLDERMSNAPSALKPGDVVLSINGHPITSDAFAPFPPDLREGQILRYTIRRASGSSAAQTLDVDVTLVSVGAAGFIANFMARLQETPRDYIVSLLSFLIVSIAFFLRPGNLGARYLFLFFGFYFAVNWLGFASSSLYAYTYPPLLSFVLNAMPTAWGWYFFPTLMLIALAFPVVKAPLRRFPRLIPALAYGLPFALTVITTYQMIASRSYAGIDLLTPMFLITFVLAVVVLFATAIHNWLTVREPVARLQLRSDPADLHSDSHHSIPVVGYRHHHPSHLGVRDSDRHSCCNLFRWHRAGAATLPHHHWTNLRPGHSHFHAVDRRVIYATPQTRTRCDRPPAISPQV